MEGSTRKERSHEELSGTTASFTENEHDSSSEVELSHDKDSKLEITLPDASRQDWGDICQTPKTEYEEIEFLPVVDFAEDIEEEDEDTQEEKSPVEISDQETEKCKAPSAEGGDSTEPISPKSSDNVPGIDTNNNNDKVCTDIHDNSQDVQTTGLPVVSLPADSITNPSQVQEKLIEHKAENIINSKGNMKEGHIGSEMLGNSAATPVTDVPSHDEERKDSLVQDEGSRSSDEDKAFAIQGHQNEQQFDNGDASLEWDDYHQHQMRSEQPDGQIVHSHDQIVRNQIESRRIHNQAEWPQDHRKRSFDHNERSHRKREEWTEGQHARNQNQRLHNQADCHHDQRGGSSDQGERFHGRTHDQADLSHDRKGQSYGQSERPHSKREEWAEGQKTYDQAEWSHDHKGRSFDHKDRFHGKKDNWTEGHKMHDQNQRPLSQVHWSNDQKGRSSEQKDRFHGKKEGMYDQIHLDQGWVNSQLEGLSDSVLINPQTRFIVLSGNIQRFLYGLRNNSFTPDIESLDNFSKILDGFKENPVVFILLRSHSRDEYHDIRIGGIAVACSPLYAVPYNDTERMQLDVKYLSTAKQSRKWDEKFVNGGEISSDKANFLFKQLRADILSGVARDIRSERPPQKDALGSNKPRHREREMGHEKHRRMDAGRRIPMWEEVSTLRRY